MKLALTLQNPCEAKNIPTMQELNTWLQTALQHIAVDIPATQQAITVRIIDREESADLNETYRHKSGPTNVLSFIDEPLDHLKPDSLGDLAICADLVAEEAQQQQKPLNAHWAHLVIHGLLHLLGYDHVKDDEAKVMETLEIKILHVLNFPNPY